MTKAHDPTVLHDEREALEKASEFESFESYFTDPDIVVDNPVPKKASKALSTAEVKRRMT